MVSTITELVATIWTDFLNACATQRVKKHKLTPFAMRLHLDERARAQLYEVPNFTTATPNAMFAVKFKGQHGLRTTVVHCSMHHNAIQCDGCSFYKRMRIPCEHIEALGNKARASYGSNYDSWIDKMIDPCVLPITKPSCIMTSSILHL